MLKKTIQIVMLETLLIFPQNYSIENILPEKGISLSLTYAMLVDHKGFLWFGTMFGLVRYDGQNYKVYRHDPFDSTSISFDDIISLFEDKSGKIWIGTWGGGLNEFDPVKEKFLRYTHNENPYSIGTNIVWAITQDKFGNIWIGNNSGILEKYNNKKNIFEKIYIPETTGNPLKNRAGKINKLLSDDNYLWICSSGKLFKYNIANEKFDSSINSKINNVNINLIYKDSKNNYWAGGNGIIKLNQKDEIISTYRHIENDPSTISDNVILSIAEDKEGNIWVGTKRGLNRFDAGMNKFVRFDHKYYSENSSGPITSIMVDSGGVVWTSSYTNGVNKIVVNGNEFKNYMVLHNEGNSIFPYPVNAVTETDNGDIFLGSYGGGILELDKTKGEIKTININDKKIKYINSILAEGNKIWVGSNAGLFLLNTLTSRLENNNFKNRNRKNLEGVKISSLMIDKKERLWVGTYGFGLFLLNKKRDSVFFVNTKVGSIKNDGKQNYYILSLKEDRNGCIWIGTYAGLFKFLENNSSIYLYNHQENNMHSLSNNYVFSLCEDKKGNLWVGTASGLNKYNRDMNNFDVYYEKDGLPSSVIDGIIEGYSGGIWISTNNGISKFNPAVRQFMNYNTKNGLTSSLFMPGASLLSRSGKIYFGSRKGLLCFDPSQIKPSNYSPPVYITSIVIGNRETSEKTINFPSGKIELKHSLNYLSISYASLDFSSPGSILYRYKLDGFENSWITADNRNTAEYKNLRPGDYTFIVTGSNSSGVWNDKRAVLNISIIPPFWETGRFFLLAILVLLITAYSVYKALVIKKLRHAVEIERIRNNERDKVRKKTAADFHDELGHRLTRISVLAELIKRKIPKSLSSIEPLLNKISENSAQLYSGTKDFIWSIDPQNDSLYDLIIRLKDFGDDIFTSTKVHFDIEGISDNLKKEILSMDLRRHFSLIFKEAMNNSLKYSGCSKVLLGLKLNNNELEISFEDNGKGFLFTGDTQGNGLKNMKKRAEKLNAELNIYSIINQGTKIILKYHLSPKEILFN